MRNTSAIAAALSVALVAIAGCSSTPTARRDQSSPYYAVPVGAVLELREPIRIRAGATRSWLQFGKATGDRFDHYAPNCNVEVRHLDQENVQLVRPGRFTVRRTQQVREEVVRARRPVRVAALWRVGGGVDAGGPNLIYEGYHLWLDSPEQPEVMRLTCRGAYAEPSNAKPPSIEEIRSVLGGIATLTLP